MPPNCRDYDGTVYRLCKTALRGTSFVMQSVDILRRRAAASSWRRSPGVSPRLRAMRLTGKGIWGEPRDHAEAIAVLRRALELGINLIDTADSYGPAVSERLIAEALYPYPPELVIATKGARASGPGQWTPNGRPEHLRAACEASLRRLKLERIELYQLHRIDPAVTSTISSAPCGSAAAGKIRHIGLSEVSVATSSGLASSCRSSRCRTGTTSSSATR